MQQQTRVALVHDYLQEFGGAERVVLALHEAFPDAPLFVGFVDLENLGDHAKNFQNVQISSTFLQTIPGIKKLRSPLRILAPTAFARLNVQDFDVIVSSTNAYHAKSIRPRPDALHVCYCHTPARSLYGYDTRSDWKKNAPVRFFGEIANHFLRLTDFQAAQAVDQVLVNSRVVASRVQKFWRREAQVLYPPVIFADLSNKFTKKIQTAFRDYYLYVNRLNLAKHPELAVQAALESGVSLKVVGEGPLAPALEAQIKNWPGAGVALLGRVPDEQLADLYCHARALLYPVADEDFGIVPVEAMAFGVPVIAHRSGGPQETILDGQTGIFFDELTVNSLKQALMRARNISFDPMFIHQHAQRFTQANFVKSIKKNVQKAYDAKLSRKN